MKENLCGRCVMETVKKLPKLNPYAMPYAMLAVI